MFECEISIKVLLTFGVSIFETDWWAVFERATILSSWWLGQILLSFIRIKYGLLNNERVVITTSFHCVRITNLTDI